jgi:curved DNA-binding protein CbpA
MDGFKCLGLERRLQIDDEALSAAFRDAGKRKHPDHGGSVEEFEEIEQAHRMLKSPGSRLRHWLELEGISGDLRGSVGSELMTIFTELGDLLQQADALIRERDAAASALAKAMLEGRTQELRDGLEGMVAKLEAMVGERVACFADIESGNRDGWELARELTFLSKWQGQVRERFGALW